jgi:hexosaminidase
MQRHITDSNSWPLDLASHPELAKYGAYSPAQKYSESDIKQIITHAGEVSSSIHKVGKEADEKRGIDVVLEIDTPGHTASIAESHPELIACFEKSPWSTYSHQPPPGQLRFASEAATEFTKAIFESTLDLIQSQYFGTGGDEINEKCMVCPHPRCELMRSLKMKRLLDHYGRMGGHWMML